MKEGCVGEKERERDLFWRKAKRFMVRFYMVFMEDLELNWTISKVFSLGHV